MWYIKWWFMHADIPSHRLYSILLPKTSPEQSLGHHHENSPHPILYELYILFNINNSTPVPLPLQYSTWIIPNEFPQFPNTKDDQNFIDIRHIALHLLVSNNLTLLLSNLSLNSTSSHISSKQLTSKLFVPNYCLSPWEGRFTVGFVGIFWFCCAARRLQKPLG